MDAHQHFWSPARGDYGWLSPDDRVLYRDFTPRDLAPLLESAGVTRTVLVQAAPTVEETRFLLDLAEATPWIAAVVGWVDLERPDVGDLLDELCGSPAFRGVRPMIQDLPDAAWMLRDTVARGLREVATRDLCFDALVLPRHLPNLLRLLEREPELRVVVDHAGKPPIASGELGRWATDLAAIASDTGAVCKLSGLATEARPDWRAAGLAPVVDHLLDTFGADRLLWGSDWPVVELAGGFDRWRKATLDLLAGASEAERAGILGANAARFYRLD